MSDLETDLDAATGEHANRLHIEAGQATLTIDHSGALTWTGPLLDTTKRNVTK